MTDDNENVEKWKARQSEFARDLDAEISQFAWRVRRNRWMHHATSLIVLSCAAVMPALVVWSRNNSPSGETAAIVVSVILTFTEGLRRVFGYRQKWELRAHTLQLLRNLRSDFNDDVATREPGTNEWMDAYRRTRAVHQSILRDENKYHFDLIAEMSKPQPGPKNSSK